MRVGEGLDAARLTKVNWGNADGRNQPIAQVDGGKPPTMAPRSDDRENPLGAGRRNHADLEQALLDAVAAVARIAGEEQHLVGCELDQFGVGEQLRRKVFRKGRKQIGRWWSRHRRRRAG